MSFVAKLIKSALFYPLLLLRGIFQKIASLIAGILVISFLISLFAAESWKIPVILFASGSIIMALIIFYDSLLIKLNPTDKDIILF